MRYRSLTAYAIGGLALSFFVLTNAAHAQETDVYTAPIQAEPEIIEVDGERIQVLSIEYAGGEPEGPCAEPFNCPMSAPTVIQPSNDHDFADGRSVIITGLSWNQTKVDVYIDGIYNGRADLRTDPSEIGNFVYRPFLPLTPGTHTMYTVARSLNERERSPQSPTVSFEVVALRSVAPIATAQPEEQKPSGETLGASDATQDATVTASSANSLLDWFFSKTDESGTGTPTGTSRFSQVRMFVVAILILALLGIGYWVFGSRKDADDVMAPRDQDVPPDDDA